MHDPSVVLTTEQCRVTKHGVSLGLVRAIKLRRSVTRISLEGMFENINMIMILFFLLFERSVTESDPSTNEIASSKLLFPLPLRPTNSVICELKGPTRSLEA